MQALWRDISTLNSKSILIVWGMKDIAFKEKELKQWECTFPEARTVRLS
jgi:haloalkane dehalogenase